jgi:basic amino acid/polyamine antiporter, APA family
MGQSRNTSVLKKELKLWHVYAIATGATLSSGFFLLPGLLAVDIGPSLILAYLLAALPLIPATFSIIELSTAMPRAGGLYYFLDRTLGPWLGTVGGIGIWLTLLLKVSFALVGMGAYLQLMLPNSDIIPIALGLALIIAVLNYFGAKKGSNVQLILVGIVLAVLVYYVFQGWSHIKSEHFEGIYNIELDVLIASAGLVYISYMGPAKVAGLSEEIKKPEKVIPLAILLSIITMILIYGFGTYIMVGVLPPESLAGDLTPFVSAGRLFLGKFGVIIITVTVFLALISVANAGMLSSSRYPLAMSRDHIFPRILLKLDKHGTPVRSIVITLIVIAIIIVFLEPLKIAKLASIFQFIVLGLVCLSVIVIRESKIASYDPGYKSPFYPWMQIIGILLQLVFIIMMGWQPIIYATGLMLLSSLWYWYYARKRVVRTGAIYHVFERLGRLRYDGLDTELRGILKEKGLRDEDPFDEIIARSYVIDCDKQVSFEEVVKRASQWFSELLNVDIDRIRSEFLESMRLGATPVANGVALPHFRADNIDQAEIVIVRAKEGVILSDPHELYSEEDKSVFAVFFVVSPDKNPTQHLRILAQIAGRVDEGEFETEWRAAKNEMQLKEVLLRDERFLSIKITKDTASSKLINLKLRDIKLPEGCLIAMIRREGQTIVPKGNTVLSEGDRLTVIGDPRGLSEVKRKFMDKKMR